MVENKPGILDIPNLQGNDRKQHGGRVVIHCPIHNERTPSFTIYPDGTAHCYGCGWHGDSIALVQALHNLDFKGALSYLGIAGDNSGEARRLRKEARRKREAVQRFRAWCEKRCFELAALVRTLDKKKRAAKLGTVERDLVGLYHVESRWAYEMDILLSGTEAEKLSLYREACHAG